MNMAIIIVSLIFKKQDNLFSYEGITKFLNMVLDITIIYFLIIYIFSFFFRKKREYFYRTKTGFIINKALNILTFAYICFIVVFLFM